MQRFIDTEDIYHLSGPDGVRSYLVEKANTGSTSFVFNSYENAYYGPWRIHQKTVGEVVTTYTDASLIVWGKYHLTPTEGSLLYSWGSLSPSKGSYTYLWVVIDFTLIRTGDEEKPVVTTEVNSLLYYYPGEYKIPIMIGSLTLDDNGTPIISQIVRHTPHITGYMI